MSGRRILIGGGVLLLLAMVIALAFLVGIVFGGDQQQEVAQTPSPETTDTQPVEATESTEQQAEADSEAVEQGETATFPDRIVTLNDVQRGYVFPSNIPKPRPGNEFVITSVTVTNTSSQPIPVNSFNFEAQDSTGARVKAQATRVPPDAIFLGRLAPSGELTGNLVFEVQPDDPTIRVVYSPQ